MHLVQVLANLCETSILGDLKLYRNLHVRLRRHTHLDAAFFLYHPSGSQDHLPAHLALDLLARGVTSTKHPPLLASAEGEADVLEIPRGHDENLLIGEVDELCLTTRGLDLLTEFINV